MSSLGLCMCFPQPQIYVLLLNALISVRNLHLFIFKALSVLLYSSFHNLLSWVSHGTTVPWNSHKSQCLPLLQQSPNYNPNCASILVKCSESSKAETNSSGSPDISQKIGRKFHFFSSMLREELGIGCLPPDHTTLHQGMDGARVSKNSTDVPIMLNVAFSCLGVPSIDITT